MDDSRSARQSYCGKQDGVIGEGGKDPVAKDLMLAGVSQETSRWPEWLGRGCW